MGIRLTFVYARLAGLAILALVCAWSAGLVISESAFAGEKVMLVASESSHGEGEDKGKVDKIYAWDPILVNLADPGGKRYLKIVMQTEITDPKLRAEVVAMNAQMKDTLITILSEKMFDDIATLSGKQELKREIAVKLNKFLKVGQIQEIYFTDFLVQ